MKQAVEATKNELDADGRRKHPIHLLRLNLDTLQKAVDTGKPLTEADVFMDKAHRRLPSLIAATNEKVRLTELDLHDYQPQANLKQDKFGNIEIVNHDFTKIAELKALMTPEQQDDFNRMIIEAQESGKPITYNLLKNPAGLRITSDSSTTQNPNKAMKLQKIQIHENLVD